MTWGAVAIAGATLGGSYLAGKSAKSAGESGAAGQIEAARIGAQAGAFRPVGVTTRFGQSQFVTVTDPETGLPVLKEAGYTLDPEIAALQEQLLGLAPGSLTQAAGAYDRIAPVEGAAQGLFGLGAQYLGESPEAVRQRVINQQTALLDPIRQREEERLGASVFGRGRAGLNIGDVGQPELFSLAQARRQQDLQLAAGAEQAAQQQIQFGQGLFGQGASLLGQVPAYQTAALSPFSAYLGGAQTIEQLGQEPLRLGAELGGRQSTAGAQAGQLLAQAGANAANLRTQGALVGPTMMAGTLSNLTSNPYFMQSMGNMSNPFGVGGMFSPYQVSTQGPSGLSQSQLLASQNF
jgi:hypothetical protein